MSQLVAGTAGALARHVAEAHTSSGSLRLDTHL
jgi:hypothetical protein